MINLFIADNESMLIMSGEGCNSTFIMKRGNFGEKTCG